MRAIYCRAALCKVPDPRRSATKKLAHAGARPADAAAAASCPTASSPSSLPCASAATQCNQFLVLCLTKRVHSRVADRSPSRMHAVVRHDGALELGVGLVRVEKLGRRQPREGEVRPAQIG